MSSLYNKMTIASVNHNDWLHLLVAALEEVLTIEVLISEWLASIAIEERVVNFTSDLIAIVDVTEIAQTGMNHSVFFLTIVEVGEIVLELEGVDNLKFGCLCMKITVEI